MLRPAPEVSRVFVQPLRNRSEKESTEFRGFGHRMLGEQYGFEGVPVIISETHPGGGPRLHTHDVEEAHVLLEGSAMYQIGDQTLTVQAPYVAKVPAGMPHAFINTGSKPMNIIAVFPSKRPEFKILGPNPLIPSKSDATK